MNYLLQNSELAETLRRRETACFDLPKLVASSKNAKEAQQELENLQAKKNTLGREIAELARDKKDFDLQSKTSSTYSKEIKRLQNLIQTHIDTYGEQIDALPNILGRDVPDHDEILRTHGTKREFSFTPKTHDVLGETLFDTVRGARTSGSRFAYLMGDAVRLQTALTQFAIATLSDFIPVIPPVLVREEAMYGTGFFPAEREQVYQVDDLYLTGTSEVALASLHKGEILDPIAHRYLGISTCFRREAGSAGRDTGGIFRVHQFDKLEMFSFVHPDESEKEHEYIVSQEEKILQALGLHYQVVNIAANDLGNPAAKKYDIEVWLPGQNKYRELTSCSNCTDYQSRRLGIRMGQGRDRVYAHTLNGTAIAIGRMLVALVENGQQEDGAIVVPEALHDWGAPKVIAPSCR